MSKPNKERLGDCNGCGEDHEPEECPYLDRERDWDLEAKDAEVMAEEESI